MLAIVKYPVKVLDMLNQVMGTKSSRVADPFPFLELGKGAIGRSVLRITRKQGKTTL